MMPLITKEEARALLPKVGDVRMEIPTVDETAGFSITKNPQRCVVVDVRPEHLWYTVQFENGFKESYKVPQLEPVNRGGSR